MAIKLYHAQLTITNGSSFLMPGAQSRLVRQTDPPHSLRQFRYATFLLLTFLLAIAGTVSMHAQTSYGSLVGTVADSTGAIVAGAEITVTNAGTNAIQKTTTGGAGNYSFVNLNPGVYSVTAARSGFESVTRDKVDVQIGGTTRVDIALPVGNTTQTVTVSATAAGLQTDSASLGGVIEGRQVEEAPLNGRNVNNLLDFIPGVTPGGGTQGSTMANGGSGNFQAGGQTQAIAYGNYQIGGAFSGQSLFFIDGVGSNIAENNVNTLVPTQDAVQEFRVSTNNVSAEFGGYGGGVIQISTKSGTNQFHGNVYEYFRNTALDANDWFSNHLGLGKSPLHQNQFGANLGGPIWKNKAFFFFSWEHESLISASPISATVPTTAELNGDFSGDPQVIYDPTTGKPFPNNSIAGRIDPTALKIVELETPAQSRVTQVPFTTNFFASAPIEGYQDQYNARIDLNPTPSDSIFARYTFWNPHNGDSDPFGTKTGAGPTGNYTQEGVFGENHVFNASTIADLRLSYLENYNFQYPLSDGFDMASISPAYGVIQQESVNKQGLLPGLGIQGYGIGAELSQLYWNNNVWGISGSVTKIVGKHTIKSGGNWRQVLWENYSNSQGLGVNSTPFYTASSPTDATTGNALASFLLGIPSSTGISSVGTWHAFLHNYGFYVEDTYQATHKLTVIAGLRWEQPGAYSEEDNLDSVLQPYVPVTIGGLASINNPVTGDAVPLTGRLAFVDSPQYSSRREEDLHWNLFSPRVGIAYRANPQTVVRSGYGISYFPAEITADSPGASPINSAFTGITNPSPGNPLIATVDNPLPNGINLPTGRTQAGLNITLGNGAAGRIPKQAYGYSQQWNLAVEQAIGSNSTFTIAYAASKGTHLVLSQGYTGTGLNLNQLPDQYHSLGAALLNQVTNPFYGILPAGTTFGSPTIAEGYLLTPHPQYTGLTQTVPRYGDSTYNALQVSYTRRFSHGGILQGAYTWSKLLSNTDNTSAFQDGQGGIGVVQDNDNLKAEKSLSQQDLAQNLVINYGLDLPFGRDQTYLANTNRFVNGVLGGWRIDGITTLRSGVPLALVAAGNTLSQFGSGNIRPNYTPGCNKNAPGSDHSPERANMWFNTSCFTQPGQFSFGDEPRVDPFMRSEGEVNFDTSFNKIFNIKENVKFKFSAEIFDLFNHAQFAEPNTNLSSPGFGQVSHQTTLPRTVQLAARISF
ncbi:MAG: carboxypeptidase-like regulatory domain-containing protein [Silvibacterium sp.]